MIGAVLSHLEWPSSKPHEFNDEKKLSRRKTIRTCKQMHIDRFCSWFRSNFWWLYLSTAQLTAFNTCICNGKSIAILYSPTKKVATSNLRCHAMSNVYICAVPAHGAWNRPSCHKYILLWSPWLVVCACVWRLKIQTKTESRTLNNISSYSVAAVGEKWSKR